MHPGGIRSDTHLFYFEKSANLKHPSVHIELFFVKILQNNQPDKQTIISKHTNKQPSQSVGGDRSAADKRPLCVSTREYPAPKMCHFCTILMSRTLGLP